MDQPQTTIPTDHAYDRLCQQYHAAARQRKGMANDHPDAARLDQAISDCVRPMNAYEAAHNL